MKHLRSTCGPSVELDWRAYQEYLESLKARIPPALAEFANVNSHYARIVKIARPKKHALAVTLSGFAYEELKSLTFAVGAVVREFAPDAFIGQALWGHEISLEDGDSLEIRAKAESNELFVCGKSFSMTTEPTD